jgi:hypothetical protein
MKSMYRLVPSPSIVGDPNCSILTSGDSVEICREDPRVRALISELLSGQYNDPLEEVLASMIDKHEPLP